MSKVARKLDLSKQTTDGKEYEKLRRARIRENKLKLEAFGIKGIAKSLTSLVDSTNSKKNGKGKRKAQTDVDAAYVPNCDDAHDEFSSSDESHESEQEHTSPLLKKAKPSKSVVVLRRKQTIAPLSMANFLRMSKKQQQAAVGDETLKKVAAALKVM